MKMASEEGMSRLILIFVQAVKWKHVCCAIKYVTFGINSTFVFHFCLAFLI